MNTKLIEMRDAKAKSHLEQYAPIWLTDEKIIPEDDFVLFNIIFQHNLYGWVNRRYHYDAFNDVLYYRGQIAIPENDALAIQQEHEPYIETPVADIVNSYGG